MYRLIFGGLFLVAMAHPANAVIASASVNGAKSDRLDVMSPFAEQRHVIEKKLADGKTYSEISVADRSKVREALTRISSEIEQAGDVKSLSPAQQARVFNDQEVVNTILTKASEDSRLVCERVEKIGTHRKTTSCMTVAERRRNSDVSTERLRQIQSQGAVVGPGG